eukprot:4629516-Pyramimonas_sp.AAC.2
MHIYLGSAAQNPVTSQSGHSNRVSLHASVSGIMASTKRSTLRSASGGWHPAASGSPSLWRSWTARV